MSRRPLVGLVAVRPAGKEGRRVEMRHFPAQLHTDQAPHMPVQDHTEPPEAHRSGLWEATKAMAACLDENTTLAPRSSE